MSSRILISPEELDSIAQQFRSAADQGHQQNQRLRSALDSLEGRWDGNTKKKFYEAFRESQIHLDKYTELLNNIETDLREIATRFRTVDGQ